MSNLLRAGCRMVLAIMCMLILSVAGGAELCDGRDNDGDGSLDEGCARICPDPAFNRSTDIPDGYWNPPGVASWNGRDVGVVATMWDTQEVRLFLADPDARLTEGAGTLVGTGDDPALDWSGTAFGVVWRDCSPPDDCRLLFARLAPDGTMLAGPVRVVGPKAGLGTPAIRWSDGSFVVAWFDGGELRVRRVDQEGQPLGEEFCLNCDEGLGGGHVSIAAAPGGLGFTWDPSGSIVFARTDLSLVRQGAVLLLAQGGDFQFGKPFTAWGAGAYAVVWADGPYYQERAYFQRIDESTGALVGPELTLWDGEDYTRHPSVVWNGEEFVVGYASGRFPGNPFVDERLNLRRITASSEPIDPLFNFCCEVTENYPVLGWTGSEFFFVEGNWTDLGGWGWDLSLLTVDCCADEDGDGWKTCEGDAGDQNTAVHPDAVEICNGRDDDLDGTLDEGCERSCAGAPLVGETALGVQDAPEIALAVDGNAGIAHIVHVDDALPGVQLTLDSGPAWEKHPVESDEAPSGEQAVCWSGMRSVTTFIDRRQPDPQLRMTVLDRNGAALVSDQPFGPPQAGREGPTSAWDGRRVSLAWLEAGDSARWTLVTSEGARLIDDFAVAGEGTAVSAVAAVPDMGGGAALAWLEEREGGAAVMLQRFSSRGGRSPRTEVAAPAAGRTTVAVVATDTGYLTAWSSSEVLPGERHLVVARTDRDGQLVMGPTRVTAQGAQADSPALAYTGEEVVVLFRDARDGGRARPYRLRLDEQGAPLAVESAVGSDRDIASPAIVWQGDSLRVAWTRGTGPHEVRTAELDCVATPVAAAVRRLVFSGPDRLEWDPVELAVYDVVSGRLDELASGAGFETAVDECEAARTPSTGLDLVERSLPRFYLVRAVVSDLPGTYDADGLAQVASRDAAIAASPGACP